MTRCKDPIPSPETPRQPQPGEPPAHGSIACGSPDLLLVLDGAAGIREISPSVGPLLAYRRGELLGTSFLSILHPDDRPMLRSLMSAEQADPQEPLRARLRVRHAEGGWRSFEVSARVVPGPDRRALLVIEAYDTSGSQSSLTTALPAMQIGGPFVPPADLASTGEFPACEDAPSSELVECAGGEREPIPIALNDRKPIDLGSTGEFPACEDAPSSELIERAGAQGETILIALDDPKVSAKACAIMRTLGYTVLEAMSPADAEGFARVHKGALDLLVADLATPRVRGRAFVRSMQAIRPGLRSLFVSRQGYGSLAERRLFESGARLLHEPFTPEELAHAVRRALETPND